MKHAARLTIAIACAAGLTIVAQSPAGPPQGERLKFEVASIKPTGNDAGRGGLEILPGGGLRMGGVTLRSLIALAYGVMEEKLSGGPAWIGSTTYEVLAKPEHPHPDDIGKTTFGPGTQGWIRLQQRLQSLLEERFQLVVHKDSKENSGYALVLAKGGSKLKESRTEAPPGTMRGRGKIEGRSGTMEMLATVLSQMLARPVADRTGLTGNYDYKLEYAQETNDGDGPPAEFGRASVFTAIPEQLGLKLEPAKVSSVTMVIDRAEKLSAN